MLVLRFGRRFAHHAALGSCGSKKVARPVSLMVMVAKALELLSECYGVRPPRPGDDAGIVLFLAEAALRREERGTSMTEDLLPAPEPAPVVTYGGSTGFIVNERIIRYPEHFRNHVTPTVFISQGVSSGKRYLSWEAHGEPANAPAGEGRVSFSGTVWDGDEGWWRKA
jgi:hypothetical protein